MPPVARERLYTYPVLQAGNCARMDCHWTTFNFSNEQPGNRFSDPNYALRYIRSNYYESGSPSVYGDLNMCRMIAFVGSKDTDLHSLFAAFRAGSQCDPYAKAAFGPEYTCHPHGWGWALYDGLNLHHFRSARPVWQDEVQLPALKGPAVCALFHSRLASNPALDSPVSSHPFLAATDQEILLLAHNGGVETDTPSASAVVDSEWALGVIARQGSLEQALPLLKERTKPNSALNLMVLAIPRDQSAPPAIHCLNFFKTQEPGRKAYYTMYTAEVPGGRLFFSSTFKDLGIRGLTNLLVAPFDQLFSLRVPAPLWTRPKPPGSSATPPQSQSLAT